MKKVAVLITVFNRIDKTLRCLDSLFNSGYADAGVTIEVYLTDDGSTDKTASVIRKRYSNIHILQGDGTYFWNGGMINSWKAAISDRNWDGYLWLNNDSIVFPNLWKELIDAETYVVDHFSKKGIYIGSTCNNKGKYSYGGFNFTNKWTLKDVFCIPNGTFQSCQCGHGNITYVSSDVVKTQGILCNQYIHGGGDHDYTYLAYKNGFPLLVLREYVGICENDHKSNGYYEFIHMKFKDRVKFLNSPTGMNIHNSLLFQKRFFPYRYPLVWAGAYAKMLFPHAYFKLYKLLRK